MKSIRQIMQEAWTEVRDTHGVAMQCASFTTIHRVDGGVYLSDTDIQGKAICVPPAKPTGEPVTEEAEAL